MATQKKTTTKKAASKKAPAKKAVAKKAPAKKTAAKKASAKKKAPAKKTANKKTEVDPFAFYSKEIEEQVTDKADEVLEEFIDVVRTQKTSLLKRIFAWIKK
jgi:hypothetical protein